MMSGLNAKVNTIGTPSTPASRTIKVSFEISEGVCLNATHDQLTNCLMAALHEKLAAYIEQIAKIDVCVEQDQDLLLVKARIYDRGNNMIVVIARESGLESAIHSFIAKAKVLFGTSSSLLNLPLMKEGNLLTYLMAQLGKSPLPEPTL